MAKKLKAVSSARTAGMVMKKYFHEDNNKIDHKKPYTPIQKTHISGEA